MKPEELKGRELACWLRGRASMATHYERQPCAVSDVAYGMVLAAAEIERLCAEPDAIGGGPLYSQRQQAARDAAALDEIAGLMRIGSGGYPIWKTEGEEHSIGIIVQRTGRKVGP